LYCLGIDAKDKIIEELPELVAKLTALVDQQAKRISELELALAKAQKDSSTSSKPPSSDIAKPKPKKKPGRPRKPRRGGQPGHQRQLREPLLLVQLLVRLELQHQSPVLLGSLDTRHAISFGETPGQ
jgi:hypothetical protein